MSVIENPVAALALSGLAGALISNYQSVSASTDKSVTLTSTMNSATGILENYVLPVGVGYVAGYVAGRFVGIRSPMMINALGAAGSYLYLYSGLATQVDNEIGGMTS